METPLDDRYEKTKQYHEPADHGLMWPILNQLLHIIVTVYSLFGMIQFKVKFIHRLVRWISYIMIAHSWYLVIKFSLICLLIYLFTSEIKSLRITHVHFNCTLQRDGQVDLSSLYQVMENACTLAKSSGKKRIKPIHAPLLFLEDYQESISSSSCYNYYLPVVGYLLSTFGGPYKFLGMMGALMYGFYAILLYVLLAIFPIELIWYANLGFNYIRFVLNDITCMQDFYEQKHKHLNRLNSWSRNEITSVLTLGMKKTFNSRDLRCSPLHKDDEPTSVARQSFKSTRKNLVQSPKEDLSASHTLLSRLSIRYPSTSSLPSSLSGSLKRPHNQNYNQMNPRLKSLKQSLSRNHSNEPDYSVQVANKNLAKFKPHVRSESWFKLSMIVYPCFMFSYFLLMILVISSISLFFRSRLREIEEQCSSSSQLSSPFRYQQELPPGTPTSSSGSSIHKEKIDSLSNWTFLDKLTFFETHYYMVFALSCATSFYCSYFFGTIIELRVWIAEISQQLNLCKLVLELSDQSLLPFGHGWLNEPHDNRSSNNNNKSNINSTAGRRAITQGNLDRNGSGNNQSPTTTSRHHPYKTPTLLHSNDYYATGSREDPPRSFIPDLAAVGRAAATAAMAAANLRYNRRLNQQLEQRYMDVKSVERNFNQFGGLNSLWAHLKFSFAPHSKRLQMSQSMAIKLITKRQTLLRATYINLNFFFDELNATRFLVRTVLKRTTQLALGFALMVSMTRSQFESDYIKLTYLLCVGLFTLNLDLIAAASINSSMTKLLHQIHELISVATKAGAENDLLEFWQRRLHAFAPDKDAMIYTIYGYRITWGSILNFNGAVTSAYMFTTQHR